MSTSPVQREYSHSSQKDEELSCRHRKVVVLQHNGGCNMVNKGFCGIDGRPCRIDVRHLTVKDVEGKIRVVLEG